jgi:hypothetical protein
VAANVVKNVPKNALMVSIAHISVTAEVLEPNIKFSIEGNTEEELEEYTEIFENIEEYRSDAKHNKPLEEDDDDDDDDDDGKFLL